MDNETQGLILLCVWAIGSILAGIGGLRLDAKAGLEGLNFVEFFSSMICILAGCLALGISSIYIGLLNIFTLFSCLGAGAIGFLIRQLIASRETHSSLKEYRK